MHARTTHACNLPYHMHMFMHTQTHHTQTQTQTHTCMHAHTHITHSCTHACTYFTHTHRHTHITCLSHTNKQVCPGFVLGSVAEEGDDWVCELFQDDHMRFLQEQLQQPDYQEALCSLPSPLYPSQNLGKIKSVQQMFSL